jgi:hypothetical protein
MTEEDARLALLQTELNAIQSRIRSLDTITFQIKGWCVTAALAIGGFAAAYRKPALLIVGIGAVMGFYLLDCQYKLVQRMLINRNDLLDAELRTTGIMRFLKGEGVIDVVGTASLQWPQLDGASYARRAIRYLLALWPDARHPSVFSLYSFILVSLIVEMAILA